MLTEVDRSCAMACSPEAQTVVILYSCMVKVNKHLVVMTVLPTHNCALAVKRHSFS